MIVRISYFWKCSEKIGILEFENEGRIIIYITMWEKERIVKEDKIVKWKYEIVWVKAYIISAEEHVILVRSDRRLMTRRLFAKICWKCLFPRIDRRY